MVSITHGDTLQVITPKQESSVRLVAITAPDVGECLNEEAAVHTAGRVSRWRY